MSSAIGERFVSLVWDALRAAEHADRGALLSAASTFLDAISPAEGDVHDAARKVAYAALDWSVCGGDSWELLDAARSFALLSQLQQMDKRLKDLQV